LDYIEGQKYAAEQAKKNAAIQQLQAAQDKDTAKEKAEHAALANGGSGSGGGSGDGGDGSGSGGGSGNKKSSVTATFGSGSYSGFPITSTPVAPSTPIEPDTTVQDSYKAAMEAANERLKQAYEYQQGQLASARDNALREAYIKQQMVERGYPEQLSAAGINGGAAQGLIARNNADYAKQRTNIQGNFLNNLGAAGQTYQQGILQNNENFLRTMAEYQQSLDEMRRKWELEQLGKSGLISPIMVGGYSSYSQPQTSAQQYLDYLRTNYGNLFK
jgi:hypothetical protein